jgi:tetratricopeptide (TPR) repeat protein
MRQEAKMAVQSRKKTTAEPHKAATKDDFGPAIQQYQAAVQLLQEAKYDKAKAAFQKLLPSAPPEFIERVRMYVNTCDRQLQSHALAFNTPEERYDYAISQLNTGYFEEAREQLNLVLKDNPRADFAYYGLAILDSITGRAQECLENLAAAIEINPRNRLQARTDNDFQNMSDDPRFTEMLYPEIP